MTIVEYLDKLAADGHLREDETNHLKALASAVENSLQNKDHEKIAHVEAMLAEIREIHEENNKLAFDLDMLKTKAKEHPLQAAGLALMGLNMAKPYVSKGYNKLVDPIREKIRYKRMMALKGRPMGYNPDVADSFYIDPALDDDTRKEMLHRKAFSILHKYSPEATKVPEIARQLIHEQSVGGDPNAAASGAFDFASKSVKNDELRNNAHRNSTIGVGDLKSGLEVMNKNVETMTSKPKMPRRPMGRRFGP